MYIRSPDEIREFLEENRTVLDLPQCYLGREPNTHHRPWLWKDKKALKILLVAPYRYEDFRGNQTLPLLYQMINEWRDDVICERAFFPSTEKEYKLFRDRKYPLFSVESKHSAGEFDIIATSLSFLPPWANFILQLEMSGIPVRREDRERYGGHYPMVMVGGSAVYGNFCIAYPVVDMIYLGDAEGDGSGGLLDLLTMWLNAKEFGLPIQKRLELAQLDFNYIFCPSFYKPKYRKEKFIKWQPVSPMFSTKFEVIKCKDLDKAPMLTKPIPSYTDATLGLGEVELSRGCRGFCSFCGIGWKYRPYRERSKEVMVKALVESKEQGGTFKGLCPIATEFAYYSEKRALLNELAKHSRHVDPLSMRVDAFASDREFDRFLSNMGMNQVALGVEGVSQRLRNRLLKGITEEEILRACQIAIDTKGFQKIKFFMLANIDETWEDYEEFFSLLSKVIGMREHVQSNMQIKVSWTPIFIEPCTPLQWKKPTIEQRQPWMKIKNALDEFNPKDPEGRIVKRIVRYPQGGGGKFVEDFVWTMQGMHLGDTRFAEAFILATLKLKSIWYTAFPKTVRHKETKEIRKLGMKDTLTTCMKKTGFSWDYIMRERGEDEAFPWDIVDRGVPKSTLLKLYRGIKSGHYDKRTLKVAPKMDKGVLDTPESGEQAFGQWYLVIFKAEPLYQVVPNSHFKAVFHRAAFLQKFPLSVGSMKFFSDRDGKNYYSGFDYFVMGVQREFTETEFHSLSCETLPVMDVVAYKKLPTLKKPKLKKTVSSYEIETGIWNKEELRDCWKQFALSPEVIVFQPRTRYYSGTSNIKIDLKEIFFWDVRIYEYGRLKVWLSHDVGIRYFLKGFFPHISFQKILKFPVKKIGLWERDEGLLTEVCNEYEMVSAVQTKEI